MYHLLVQCMDLKVSFSSRGCRRLADRSACCDQFIIGAPPGHKFIMCVLFYDSSVGHHCYDVSSLDSRQPVSDDDASSTFSRFIQSGLHTLQENRDLSDVEIYIIKKKPCFMLMLCDG